MGSLSDCRRAGLIHCRCWLALGTVATVSPKVHACFPWGAGSKVVQGLSGASNGGAEKPYTVAGWMRTCWAVWLDAATLSFSPGNT